MTNSWQKKILFFIYFIFTTILPLFLFLSKFPLRNSEDFFGVVVLGLSILICVVVIGKYEWKLMPASPSKVLVWFFLPIIILVFNFFYFGKDIFLSSLWVDGIAILSSIVLALILIESKQDLLNSKVAKDNLEKYKTPFLNSYWQKKHNRSFSNSIGKFITIPGFILAGVILYIRQVSPLLSYQEHIRFLFVFLISVITNISTFYKAEFSKYES